MRHIRLALLLPAAVAFCQTPAITNVQDAAAYTADVAQGAVFVVKGTNLSDAGFVQAPAVPYPATLNNVDIKLTAVNGGAVVPAMMVYTFNQNGVNQLAAVLPSTAATGAYDVRVTNKGATSQPFRINVVSRKPGVVTADSSGSGEAQATLSGQAILARKSNQGKIGQFDTRPAKPGERVDLWGTGVGADASSDTGGTSGDQTAAGAIRVLVNGAEVMPLYAGRSQGSPGLDQIVFNMPNDVTPGCSVRLQVRAGGVMGNLVTIAVSTTDTCSDNTSGGGGNSGGSGNPTPAEIESWIAKGSFVSGTVLMNRGTAYSINPATGATTVAKADSIAGVFTRSSGADLAKQLRGELPPGFPNLAPTAGSCVVYNLRSLTNPYPNLTFVNLDAGPQLSVSGPNGSQAVPRVTNQSAGPVYSTLTSLPNTYLTSGSYTISGPGGTAIGAFSGSTTMGTEFVVTNNPDDFKTINRGSGVTVRWSGGDPSTFASISGSSVDQSQAGAAFICIERVSAGQFTVPASILTQLPASTAIGAGGVSFVLRGTFGVTASSALTRLPAPQGADILTVGTGWNWSFTPQYQ
ncbi:MAG: hypothetical protein U0Q16_09015 [Bryobacteraceae bacterium]